LYFQTLRFFFCERRLIFWKNTGKWCAENK